MLEAIELLEKEIERVEKIARVLRAKIARLFFKESVFELHARMKYREEEARRLQLILDILEREYYDFES